MYGDMSRLLDGLSGQFSGVLAQQGRLLLDSELNEQNAILLDYLRCLATDLIGPFAGPVDHAGFEVEPVVRDGRCRAVRLRRGRYYVYGLRCETPPPHQPANREWAIGVQEGKFVVYLVVWEQSVSAIQAPELIDPALPADVPDTTRRRQVRWRPAAGRTLPRHDEDLTDLDRESIIRAFREYDADPRNRPTLAARPDAGGDAAPGPATASVPWGYRGMENQLYRVEVYRGGHREEATFVWSRNNGTPEFGLTALTDPPDGLGLRTATLQRGWYDSRQGLEVDDWVELVDDTWAPLGTPAPLMQVKGVSLATRQVTLQDGKGRRDFDLARHPLLRRWDQRPGDPAASEGIPVREADRRWFELEDGVQIRFDTSDAYYEHGDYWLIPARTGTGLLWPQSQDTRPVPLALPPYGPARYLAPLALVHHLPGEPTNLRTLFEHRVGEREPPPSGGTTGSGGTAARRPRSTSRTRQAQP
jgi:hypothetical protein